MPTSILPPKVASTLSPADFAQVQQDANAIAAAGSTTPAAITVNRFTWFAAFDGTRNDRDNLAASGDTQDTNVAQLEKQVAAAIRDSGSPAFGSKYYSGIGADGSLLDAGPLPTAKAVQIAEVAYQDFSKAAIAYLAANPGQAVQLMLAADSRGDAVSAMFAQMVYERGISNPQTGELLVAPGAIRIAGLVSFDPVNSLVNGSVRYPPIVDNAVVIRAEDEQRSDFKATDRTDEAGFTTIGVRGNHGNIIGFFDNSIGAQMLGGETGLGGATGYFINRGMPIAPVDSARLFDPSAPANIYDSSVTPVLGLDGSVIYAPAMPGNTYEGARQTQTAGGPSTTTQYNPDGSVQTSFTDYLGRVVTSTQATNADHSTTVQVAITAGNPPQVISQTHIHTSADGNTQVLSVPDGAGGWAQTTVVRTPYPDGSFILTKTYPDGRIVSSIVGDDGKLSGTEITIPTLLGSETTRFNAAGDVLSTTTRQTDDDGNILIITTHADGSGTARALDPAGHLINEATFQRDGGIEGSSSGTLTEEINDKTVVFDISFDQNGPIELTGIRSIDDQTPQSADAISQRLQLQHIEIDEVLLGAGSGALGQLITVADPLDADGMIPVVAQGGQPWYFDPASQAFAASLSSIQSLIAGLQSGKPLPTATGLFGLGATFTGAQALVQAGDALGVVNAMVNLRDIFERGDVMSGLYNGAVLGSSALKLYKVALVSQTELVNAQALNQINAWGELPDSLRSRISDLAADIAAVDTLIQGLGQAIPLLSLATAVQRGDALGAASAGLAYLNAIGQAWAGPVGWMVAQAEVPEEGVSHIVIDSCLWPFDDGIGLESFEKPSANQSEWRHVA